MEYHTGDTLELELTGLSSDGRAVGRSAEGMTVFVRGGLPGLATGRLFGTGNDLRAGDFLFLRVYLVLPEDTFRVIHPAGHNAGRYEAQPRGYGGDRS